MLVYKGMDIGTAKPSLKDRRLVPHHGIDIIPPTKNFSVFEYREFAMKKIHEIVKRGRLPIVAGGTGFYIRALLEGLSPQPEANPVIRRKLEQEAKRKGKEALYKRLLKIDPKRARAIGPHNMRRLIRALEIYFVAGKKPSRASKKYPGLRSLGYRPVVIGLNRDRAALYQKINERVDRMFAKGLVKEVRQLSKKRLSVTSRQGVGYKEVLEVLRGPKIKPGFNTGCQSPALSWVKERIKQATRHFAKRQWTWFKKEKGIQWVWWPESASVQEICNYIFSNFPLTSSHSGKAMRSER